MAFNYKEQYGVIVICKDEKEQRLSLIHISEPTRRS